MTTISDWIDGHAVAFGTVRFYPIGNGGWPEWSRVPVIGSKLIPGTGYGPSRVKRQVVAFRPATVVYDVWLTSDGYAQIDALQGTAATLTMPVGTTSYADRQKQIVNDLYDILDGVILNGIDTPKARVGGLVRCSLTFERTS